MAVGQKDAFVTDLSFTSILYLHTFPLNKLYGVKKPRKLTQTSGTVAEHCFKQIWISIVRHPSLCGFYGVILRLLKMTQEEAAAAAAAAAAAEGEGETAWVPVPEFRHVSPSVLDSHFYLWTPQASMDHVSHHSVSIFVSVCLAREFKNQYLSTCVLYSVIVMYDREEKHLANQGKLADRYSITSSSRKAFPGDNNFGKESRSRRKTPPKKPRHIDSTSSAKIGAWSLVHGKRKKLEARSYRGWLLGTAKSPGTTSEAKRRLFCLDKKGSFYLNSKRCHIYPGETNSRWDKLVR